MKLPVHPLIARGAYEPRIEPWSETRAVWLRWLGHHRPSIRIRSVSAWDSYCTRAVEQFLPRMQQYPNQGNFYSYRYTP